MELTGLHLLLSYQCTFECDHCFVWGSPWQEGTMTIEQIRDILEQARQTDSIRWIYFEGGEPFLYYMAFLTGVKLAKALGFKVGVVTNSYWATSEDDAIACLTPIAGLVDDLSISSDLYHYNKELSQQAQWARSAAEHLVIPVGMISIAQPAESPGEKTTGQLPIGESRVMYRGRAAKKLVSHAEFQPWNNYMECPEEDLIDPSRVHLDPLGYLHICQGITIGNIYDTSLNEICSNYNPYQHPILGRLMEGGPANLVKRYDLPHALEYADACHLCYEARTHLRDQFPAILAPDQMYGVINQ